MYSRPYAYAVGFFGGDRGIRNLAHRLYAGRRRWCAPVKLWEDDKFFVKSFTATSYLPLLLVRSSSCSVLVLARWCLRVGACVSVLFLFGAGALADLKRFNELLDVVRWPWFLQEVAICFVPRGCTSRYCTFFLHIDASTGIIPKLSF
jgi:hypothetical protein